MNYRFHPEAEFEIAEVMDYYDIKQSGLGQRFREAVENVIRELSEVTAAGPVVVAGCRFRLTRHYPYVVYYRIEGDEIHIVAVIHDKRDADVILGRLAD